MVNYNVPQDNWELWALLQSWLNYAISFFLVPLVMSISLLPISKHGCKSMALCKFFFFCLSIFTEPDWLHLYIFQKWPWHCYSREMSIARLPRGFPHLPVCDMCLQPCGSHGPDSLCHRADQVKFAVQFDVLAEYINQKHVWEMNMLSFFCLLPF